MTIYTRVATVSAMLIITGISLMTPLALSYLKEQPAAAEAATSAPTVQPVPPSTPAADEVAEGKPRHITVPSLGISLAVADGFYSATTGAWTLDDYHAFYGTPTSPANSESGNTFVYGHNSREIFGLLPQMAPGDTAVITTDTGYEFTYELETSEKVKPTDTIVLAYDGPTPRLTLQTCTIWGEMRHMFYFKLSSYRKL